MGHDNEYVCREILGMTAEAIEAVIRAGALERSVP